MILILMGVAGSGKSSVAEALHRQTGWDFVEGDNYHPQSNREKMAAGMPLTDEDRAPWLDALQTILARWSRENRNGILTCSALKKSYRGRLTGGIANTQLIWLDPPPETLASRLAHRTGHYFNPTLLTSQLATLEAPDSSEDALHITAIAPPNELARQILERLRIKMKQKPPENHLTN